MIFAALLIEIGRRKFTFSERRLLQRLAELTHLRGEPEVQIATVERFAQACGCTRSNLVPVVERLIAETVIGREERTRMWWIEQPSIWQREVDEAAAAAAAALLAGDEQRLLQREFLQVTTAAELAASEIQTWAASEKQTVRLKNRRGDEGFPPRARAHAHQENQEPEYQERRRRKIDLAGDALQLLDDIQEFCLGEKCTASQLENWRWRASTNPALLERAFREAEAMAKRREIKKSRWGTIKIFWREWGESGRKPVPQVKRQVLPVAIARAESQGGGAALASPIGRGALRAAVAAALSAK